MYHRVKKIKFGGGIDANRMLMRKLTYNFLTKGKLKTTISKAKVLKSFVEHIVEKSKERSEANKNFIMHYITDSKMINMLFNTIGPAIKDVKGGYLRIVKLGARESDATQIGVVEWAYPIVFEKPVVKIKEKSVKKEVTKIK
ncbi:MAG: 50S ribosomal protein L17 [bacterium]|nr:50S ribosomal protein L17 [bacterium]